MGDSKETAFSRLLVQSLSRVQGMEMSLSDEQLRAGVSPELMATKISDLVASLQELIDASNELNELTLQEVPVEIFDYLDVLRQDGENPAHFEQHLARSLESKLSQQADRVLYLKVFPKCTILMALHQSYP